MTLKPCDCEHKAKCLDSRACKTHRRRRYVCESCGAKWTTIEVTVEGTGTGVDSLKALTDKLKIKSSLDEAKELAQKILSL